MSSLHRLPPNEMSSKANTENTVELIDDTNQDSNMNMNMNMNMNNSNSSAAFGKSFESLHISIDGQVVIASSNLFGQHMNGFITKFNAIPDVPLMPNLSLNPSFGGICNLIGMRDKRVICGFDSGHISLLNNELEEQVGVIYHDNQICRLNVNKLQTKTVSCGYDSSIIVLDLETFMPIKFYNYAHSSYIWDVDFNPFDDHMLLSCGRDRNVLLWDLRQAKPATKLASLKSEPTALCWSLKDNSNAYIGCSSGQLLMFDVRHPGHETIARNTTANCVYRLKIVFKSNALAVCADDNAFRVYDFELLDCIYEDKTLHSDWVRDVAEHEKLLYTVGRDTRLVSHTITTTF